MSGSDRSWTVGPTLLWFAGCLVIGLFVLDGGVAALADRLTARRAPEAMGGAGPSFAAHPEPHDTDTDTDTDTDGDADPDPEAAEAGSASAQPAVGDPAARAPLDRRKIRALEDVCLDGTPDKCKRWAMDGYYRAFTDAKKRSLGRALRVSWYGDSVIANDAIPGRLRGLLQGEVGDGGPGFVFAAPPHRFCSHEAVVRSTSGDWTAHAISTVQIADGLYGVGGSTAETRDGKVTFKLATGTASRLELHYLGQPKGGSARLSADGAALTTVATQADAKQAGYATARIDGGASKFEIATTGKVRLFGLDLENESGAVVDNFGVVSVHVKSFTAHNTEAFHAALKHRGADLVMFMIGANEAHWMSPSDRALKDYQSNYERLLAEVRRARPEAACLVISPTDQAEAKDDGYASRAVVPGLIAAQRRAAHGQGCAFYSTYDWMGGKGSAVKWYKKGLVSSDFAHLSRKGAGRFTDSLFGTLMAGYQAYAAH